MVKVGTSVLTGAGRDARPGPDRPPGRADQRGDGPGLQGRAGELRRGRRGDGPARLAATPRQPPPAPGGRGRRPVLPDPRLRRGLPPPPPARRPAPAHPRGLRQPVALPEHAEHAARPVRVRCRPGDQRERHDQRRRDQVRRQRPAGGDGHEPAPGAAAGHPERGRRPLPRPTRPPATPPEVVALVPPDRRRGPRPGRCRPQRDGDRRHAEQAGGGRGW